MEPYLKKWYDSQKEGKLLGVRCRKCGNVEFPPVPVCNKCGALEEMDWFEMSGKGKVTSFSFSPFGIASFHNNPVTTVWVEMEEGPTIMSWSDDFPEGDPQEQLKMLPMSCVAEIRQLDQYVWFPVFHVTEDTEE